MSELKKLIAKGKDQGYLIQSEILGLIPDDIIDPEQIEDILQMIRDMKIEIRESDDNVIE